MDRSQATYEAYDGVELRLLNERVVRCEAVTVAEAVRYLRLLSRVSEHFEAHHEFMAEFPERIGIADVPLRDLGFSIESPLGGELDGGLLTVCTGLELLRMLFAAEGGDPGAQSDFLDKLPAELGADLSSIHPADIFEFGRLFAQELYELLYGLASDFLTHLITGPRGQVLILRRAMKMEMAPVPKSTPVSTI